MDKINTDKKNLRKFGITMGIVFLAITVFILVRHRHSVLPTTVISAVFFIFALIAPILLKLIYIFWMRLAFVLAWINTRLILAILFYLVFTPIGLGMRLFGVDLLDRKIDKGKETSWRKKDKRGFSTLNYERQF